MSHDRLMPLYCAYCAGEDLRPDEVGHGAWRCSGCLRVFSVKFLGLVRSETVLGSEVGT